MTKYAWSLKKKKNPTCLGIKKTATRAFQLNLYTWLSEIFLISWLPTLFFKKKCTSIFQTFHVMKSFYCLLVRTADFLFYIYIYIYIYMISHNVFLLVLDYCYYVVLTFKKPVSAQNLVTLFTLPPLC
jgi:hypothetical protein